MRFRHIVRRATYAELIAPQPRWEVVTANNVGKPARYAADYDIACQMTLSVVDHLQRVDINNHGERPTRRSSSHSSRKALEGDIEYGTIIKAGQAVSHCSVTPSESDSSREPKQPRRQRAGECQRDA